MSTKKNSSSVIHELKQLTERIHTTIPDVPGKHRLVRMCQKETAYFESLSSESIDDAVVCSNLPYFKAITTLANAYGSRLVDLLCRYRLPLKSVDSDLKDFIDSTYSGDNDYSRFEKQDSLLIELVCTQLDEGVDGMSRFRTCNGNAAEACLWAPALWIKVVIRDSSRLNNAWRGEASSKHVACLGRQAEELVFTSHWYQRGQPQNWIRVIVHWLPHSSSIEINDLDEDLREHLEDIGVILITGSNPWISKDLPAISTAYPNYSVSLQRLMLPLFKFRNFLNCFIECENSSDFKQFKLDAVEQIFQLLNRLSSVCNKNDSMEVDEMLLGSRDLSITFTVISPMDAVLQRTAVWPFSPTSYDHIDESNRVNLDISALIAFVSELSQFNPTYSSDQEENINDKEAISAKILDCLQSPERHTQLLNYPPLKLGKFKWLIASEAEVPVLLPMDKYLRVSWL